MDALQDDGDVKGLLADQARLENARAPLESVWREIDERVDPIGGGGFGGRAIGEIAGTRNFDATAVTSADRCTAAIAGITIPRNQQYLGLKFADKDLDKLPNVRRWCERAGDRLYAMRYAPHAGFEMQAHDDIKQTVKYGPAPFWIGVIPHEGFFYKAIDLSECWFEEDFRGRIDTVHRKHSKTVRQLRQQYGEESLSPKMREAIKNDKWSTDFEVLIVIRPNRKIDQDKLDWRAKPIESVHIAIGEKWVMRRSGFHSNPIPVSRYATGSVRAGAYGASAAMKVLGTILGANKMAQTNLRAANKAVDPALAFADDDGISSIITRPNGSNPGLMTPEGRLLVARMPGGEAGLPFAMEMLEGERAVIKTGFLEEVFKVLTDPGDRWTATQVLEMVAKQGILVAPYAGRYETEKEGPRVARELEEALRHGQIEELPPEVREAGAWPLPNLDNPLAKMARAQEAAGLTRLIETLAPMAQADPQVFDVIDTDKAAIGVADVLNVRASWLRDPEAIAAIRKGRSDAQMAQQGVEQLATAAGAFKDLAAGNAQAAA